MREVPATEFTRNYDFYREVVQREPVAVTSQGKPTAYFVSSVEYEELQRYKNLVRQSFSTWDLSADEVKSIAAGRMSPEHNHLDALLDDV